MYLIILSGHVTTVLEYVICGHMISSQEPVLLLMMIRKLPILPCTEKLEIKTFAGAVLSTAPAALWYVVEAQGYSLQTAQDT